MSMQRRAVRPPASRTLREQWVEKQEEKAPRVFCAQNAQAWPIWPSLTEMLLTPISEEVFDRQHPSFVGWVDAPNDWPRRTPLGRNFAVPKPVKS